MKFTDFEPKELIGKKVLIQSRYNSEIKTIERVTKAGFGFNNSADLFALHNGRMKGGSSWSFTYAELISEESANELVAKWAAAKLAKRQKEELSESIKSLTNEQTSKLYESLKQITNP